MSTEQNTQNPTVDNNANGQQETQQYNSTPLSLDSTSNHQGTPPQSCIWRFVHKHHSFCFAVLIFFVIAMVGTFLWCSNSNLKSAQHKIVEDVKLTQEQTE